MCSDRPRGVVVGEKHPCNGGAAPHSGREFNYRYKVLPSPGQGKPRLGEAQLKNLGDARALICCQGQTLTPSGFQLGRQTAAKYGCVFWVSGCVRAVSAQGGWRLGLGLGRAKPCVFQRPLHLPRLAL